MQTKGWTTICNVGILAAKDNYSLIIVYGVLLPNNNDNTFC